MAQQKGTRHYTTLSFDELTRCREIFNHHVEDNATSTFDLKIILSELGQYPTEDELAIVMKLHNGKVSFNTFSKYMEYLKYKFILPEPKDNDTVRAFAALGGGFDKTGIVLTDYLRDTCKHFDLRINIDQMIQEVDTDNSGSITFTEFKAMWDHNTLEEDGNALQTLTQEASMGSTLRRDSTDENTVDKLLLEKKMRDFFFPPMNEAPPPVPQLRAEDRVRKRSTGGNQQVTLVGSSKDVSMPMLPSIHKQSMVGSLASVSPRKPLTARGTSRSGSKKRGIHY
eukprot:PhF_6_TR13231/c1_g1_i1/m.20935